jgi:hypothetical protein
MIAALLIVVVQITTRASAPRQPAEPLRRMSNITQRLRRVAPEIMPNPSLAPLVEYLAHCTAANDRILVAGFRPRDSGSRTPAVCRAAADMDSGLLR